MRKYLGLSRYGLGVVALYALLIPFFVVFMRGRLRYDIMRANLALVIAVFIFTLLVFFALLAWRMGRPSLHPSRMLLAVVYGLLFALPEEILFRGMVQGSLQAHLASVPLVILLSSFIFGIAHLPNGAKSIGPRGWNWGFAGLTFLGGFPLGLLFVLTGSLLTPTVLHAMLVAGLQSFKKKNQKNLTSMLV